MATTPQYNFTVTQLDLEFILKQIKFAEQSTVIDANGQGQVADLANIITGGGSVTSAAVLPYGLRTVDGSWNSLLPGQERLGAADNIMPRLTELSLDSAQTRPAGIFGPFGPPAGTVVTSYTQTSGAVYDNQPRIASNLISDQTANNPAAVAAALQLAGHPNPFAGAQSIVPFNDAVQAANVQIKAAAAAILAAGSDPVLLAAAELQYTTATSAHAVVNNTLVTQLTNLGLTVSDNGTIGVLNLSPDIGLSPSFNSWMTVFGQFFDHGLDLVSKGGNGTVYVPLLPDDPLYVAGSSTNFMVLTRATQVGAGADGILGDNPTTLLVNEGADDDHDTINTTTPFVDQNQTYTSHPSHQVFLREYALDPATGKPFATGHLLDGAHGEGTWADVKLQAREMLGIQLVDMDVHNVPLLATDRYGEFIRGPNGYPQMVTTAGLLEGDPTANGGLGVLVPVGPTVFGVRTDHAFLNDIAHGAAPGFYDADPSPTVVNMQPLLADSDSLVGSLPNPNYNPALPVGPNNSPVMPQAAGTYDNELLDRHFITGDGRGNENIGLTTVHTIFHSEHNRLVEDYKHTILQSGDRTLINEWLRTPLAANAVLPTTPAGVDAMVADLNATNAWDGERLFQAGRFVTEMQYQHMVFEEFARAVQPSIDPFIFSNSPDIDPSIMAEFAHVVYRFGHSMLTEDITRIGADMQSDDIGLIAAFLNPVEFDKDGALTVEEATGAIVRGMSRDTGNEIDEFVTEALRNNLVGLPLDLAVLNMARARDTGMPSFNEARAAFYAATGDSQLEPLTSWADMTPELKNPMSIINFIAAYGTHTTITGATTLAGKRAAAMDLVFGTNPSPATADRMDFLNSTGAWTAANSGLNDVDFWIGGLAERKNEFGGMLGATFNYVFETQLEKLQNGDRFYYLSRTQGTNMLNELENNTFSKIVMRNSDLGEAGSSHLSSLLFQTPDYILELNQAKQIGADPETDNPILQILHPMVIRVAPGLDGNGGFLQFTGGEHVVLGGTAGNDTLKGGNGIDTLWGDAGNDRLDGGNEADQVHGGDGDDIITDAGTPAGGADFLHGDEGNDVISSGMGNDIVFGGGGSDFIITGNDFTEVFAGRGDDFILGGVGPDGLMGNEGNDWIEGGEGFDGLSGENSELFFNSPIIGHDVLNGQGNDTDYDGESGDDIMVQGTGIQRSNGMFGFDWAIHKGDPVAANSDLGIPFFPAQAVFTLRDRFDSVEGLSGWNLNDTLTGASVLKGAAGGAGAGPGNPPDESALKSQNVNLINGLAQLLGFDTPAELALLAAMPINTTVLDTTTGAEIILGGGGSDMIQGNLGNDILDGDAWLNVRIAVSGVPGLTSVDSMNEIKARMLTGEINPGQLSIVREILQSTTAATDVDTAVYNRNASEYTVVLNADGSRTVTHTPVIVGGGGVLIDDGVDTIRHFERLQFADRTIVIGGTNSVGTGTIAISDTAPIEDSILLATGIFADADLVNASTIAYTWEAEVNPGQWIQVGTGTTFTPGDTVVNLALRVKATFLDMTGVTETVYSAATAPVLNINDAPVGVPTITGVATEDQVLTANSIGISDADGMGTISYQWTRNGVAIVGATNPTLTLGDADAGAVIRVQAIYTDGNGTVETVISAPTAPVLNINDAPFGSPTAVLASGTEDVVYTVTAASLLQGFTDVDPGAILTVTNLTVSSGTLVNNNNGTWNITQAANFNGPVTLNYSVTDGLSAPVAASRTYNVAAVNDAPVGVATAVLVDGAEDAAYTVTLASLVQGFTDIDAGAVLNVSGLIASNGTVVNNGDGTFTITPAANFNGTMGLSYSVIDGNGGSVAATQSYGVTAVNDAPTGTATAVLAAGTEDIVYIVSAADLLAGFTDVDASNVLSISGLSTSVGTLSVNGDGTWTITQAANFNGPVSLTYNVIDSNGGTIAASQSYNVAAVNDAPTGSATAPLAGGAEDAAYIVSAASLLQGFTDVDAGFVLNVSGLTASNGTVVDNLNGTFTITPAANFNGTMGLTYSVIDGAGGSVAASQSYSVAAVNDAPTGVATAALAAGTEDVAYTVSAADLLAGFSDIDGDFLDVSGLTASNGIVTDNGDGTFTITPAHNFNGTMGLSYSVIDGNGGAIAASRSYSVAAVSDMPNLDFNGDGKSDILWRNTATGANTIWQSGSSGAAQTLAGVANQDWKVVGTGDFNGDGKADILWRNTVTGADTIWRSGDSATVQAVTAVANQDWKVVGTGDFDGDGKADILWRNSVTGADTIWRSGDSATVQAVTAVANLDWKVVGTGDFNGDGKDDILWRNTATGADAIWKSGDSAAVQAVTAVGNLDWKVVGTGDFDGNGTSDILWRNSATGANTIWRSGDSAAVQAVATEADLNMKVMGTGDFDGDGKADILWRNSVTGADTIWKSGNTATAQAVTAVANQDWSMIDGLETGDLLTGGAGNNTLLGTLKNDVIFGGTGRDMLTGSAGADTFVYTALNQSGVLAANRDLITDFVNGSDRIDLAGIDANSVAGGNNAFTFIGNGAFSAGGAAGAGQLRYSVAGVNTIVEGDVDGNGTADFQIQLTGNHTMTAADLVL